jgi:hypothetical protein
VPPQEIREGLELIRLRQRRMGYLLAGLVPFVLVAGYLGDRSSDSEIPFILAAVVYGVLLLGYSLRLAFTDCPRCHAFYHWSWWANPWTQRCLHCGLALKAGLSAKEGKCS